MKYQIWTVSCSNGRLSRLVVSLFDRRFDVVGDGNNPEGEDFISAVEKVRDVMFPALMFPIWFYKNIYKIKAFKTFVENYDKIYSYLTEAEGIGRRRQARRNQRRGSENFCIFSCLKRN